jgi:aspartyl-tRNA(Asn)/glutamyl-tRNA(Gln) amidotransferase subunit B
MDYEAVIGLEVHVQLKTKSKAFCGCPTEFGKEPNSQTCPVCLGFPGSLPVLNKQAFLYSIKVGLALNCAVQDYTKFDRKHYYYPDLPKNFQISQYDLPISINGFLDIYLEKGPKRVRIKRAHLEEDAGKLIHGKNSSLVDFNRAGMPLLEIVSEPDIQSPDEAYEYLVSLKSILQYLDVSDCDMEKGTLRCDANISVRMKGVSELGTKTELKNMNSFKGVKDALAYEIERQTGLVNNGGKIIQETRLWDTKELKTIVMRTKEEAKDYRYFPEPDLPPFLIKQEQVREIKETIPELPREKYLRFMKDYGLTEYDAKILVATRKDAEFSEACINAYKEKDKKVVVNWLSGALLSEANNRNCALSDLGILPQQLAELIGFVKREEISNLSGKSVLADMVATGKQAAELIEEKNLLQISDLSGLDEILMDVIKQNPKSVADYKTGKINALMFLTGQVMRMSKGKANPKVVQELLKGRLADA